MKKYLILCFCLLILLISIGLVTANNVDTLNSDDFAVKFQGGDNPYIISFDDIGDVSLSENTDDSNSWNTIKDIIENAKDDEVIYLNGSRYTATEGCSAIKITKNITINGGFKDGSSATATLDGNNITNILETTANLILINIDFINGYGGTYDAKSGAIYGEGSNLTVIGCHFFNNMIISDGGSDIYVKNCNLSVIDSYFVNNSAIGYSGYYGGIFAENCNLSIIGSYFVNNSDSAGFIKSYFSKLSIFGSYFINNNCISIFSMDETIIVGSYFVNNYSPNQAGLFTICWVI